MTSVTWSRHIEQLCCRTHRLNNISASTSATNQQQSDGTCMLTVTAYVGPKRPPWRLKERLKLFLIPTILSGFCPIPTAGLILPPQNAKLCLACQRFMKMPGLREIRSRCSCHERSHCSTRTIKICKRQQ